MSRKISNNNLIGKLMAIKIKFTSIFQSQLTISFVIYSKYNKNFRKFPKLAGDGNTGGGAMKPPADHGAAYAKNFTITIVCVVRWSLESGGASLLFGVFTWITCNSGRERGECLCS